MNQQNQSINQRPSIPAPSLTHDPLNPLDLLKQFVDLLLATPNIIRIEEMTTSGSHGPKLASCVYGGRENALAGKAGLRSNGDGRRDRGEGLEGSLEGNVEALKEGGGRL